MNSRLLLGGAVIIALVWSCSCQRIKGEDVEYRAGGEVMNGYVAHDAWTLGQRPGVLVVHEWWGHNDYARKRADMLAGLGYVAMALDMYGGGRKAGHPSDAGKFAGEVMKNFDTAVERFNAALEILKKRPDVDPGRIAAIGYCFGGGVVLNMARHGADLRGVVSFHGSLAAVKPAKRGAVKAKILVLNGADDPFTSREQVASLKKEMADAGAAFTFLDYPGAKHSFTNPAADRYGKEFKLPLEYNAEADRKSWEEMRKFLVSVFEE